ncbi:universal stress protein [Ruania alba]|uniref:Nucleotide-binding universal stress protein, UspA family n=1 Tax=Ruania alba TaxID=648782 RepID=A0A1H5KDN8_9MICO|nr:universal stress protein [Ruania alba]SEE62587.1 Nucleotide-binding universal stress protein, UspA family [Ruania alba]
MIRMEMREYPWVGTPAERPLVVGVEPGQDARVLRTAAEIAQAQGTGVVAVWVDPTHVLVAPDSSGVPTATPVDPDGTDTPPTEDEREVRALVHGELAPSAVPWRFVSAVGEVARGLAHVAASYRGVMIVVGARRPGFSGWMNEVIGGSVAGHLAHTQDLPVLVVPLHGGASA